MTITIDDQLEVPSTLKILQDPTYLNVVRGGSTTPLNIPVEFAPLGNTLTSLKFSVTYNTACLATVTSPAMAGFVDESPAGTLNFAFGSRPVHQSIR